MDPFSQRLAWIAEKLQEARRSGADGFGVAAHGLRMNPPLRAGRLAELEAEHGLYLPEDYRAFLLTLGDGGAGPYYGIPPLAEAVRGAELGMEFPLSYGEETAGVAADELLRGSVRICEQGCAYHGRLVLSGPARGRVVYVDTDGGSAPHFVRDESFLDWYERWLDELIAGDLEPWFGFEREEEPERAAPPEVAIPDGPWRAQLERIRTALYAREDVTGHSAYEPPVTAEAIAEMERFHDVQLPEEYTAFLQAVEGGGAGPYYGITPFGFALPSEEDSPGLADPFPATPERAGERPLAMKEEQIFPPGSAFLAHMGLGLYAFLVVTGPAAGRVYYLDTDRTGCVPYFVRDAHFLDWYERWLQEGGAAFGFDNPAYVCRGTPPKITWKPAVRGVVAGVV